MMPLTSPHQVDSFGNFDMALQMHDSFASSLVQFVIEVWDRISNHSQVAADLKLTGHQNLGSSQQ